MKFTEEQYQKIVELFEEQDYGYNMGLLNPEITTRFQRKIYNEFSDVMYFVEDWKVIAAIANPLTRELAHEKFVEKEKKYYWTSKKRAVNDVNKKSRIYREEFSGALLTYTRVTHDHKNINEEEQLTESEIKAWGYNPEMFDREEV